VKEKECDLINVLHIVHWPRSGIGVVVRSLLESNRIDVINMSVACLIEDKIFLDQFKNYSCVDSKELNYFRNIFRRLFIRKDNIKPDIVHVHSLTPHLKAFVKFRKSVGYVLTVHSNYPYLTKRNPKSVIKKTLQRMLIRLSDAYVVSVSKSVAELVECSLKVPRSRVIYNGVSVNEIVADDSRVCEVVPPSKFKLITVGRLSTEKGFDKLIRATALCRQVIPNIKLTIVGDGADDRYLKNLVHKCSLQNNVVFTGYLDNPTNLFRDASIFVCASTYEGFGLALIEAMSAGLAIITTPVGVANEIIKDGINGFLIKNNDPKTIADKILEVYRCTTRIQYVRENAVKEVRSHFTKESCYSQYVDVYKEIARRIRHSVL